jgi:hypothetical protein
MFLSKIKILPPILSVTLLMAGCKRSTPDPRQDALDALKQIPFKLPIEDQIKSGEMPDQPYQSISLQNHYGATIEIVLEFDTQPAMVLQVQPKKSLVLYAPLPPKRSPMAFEAYLPNGKKTTGTCYEVSYDYYSPNRVLIPVGAELYPDGQVNSILDKDMRNAATLVKLLPWNLARIRLADSGADLGHAPTPLYKQTPIVIRSSISSATGG